jgi:hypothetical protein
METSTRIAIVTIGGLTVYPACSLDTYAIDVLLFRR